MSSVPVLIAFLFLVQRSRSLSSCRPVTQFLRELLRPTTQSFDCSDRPGTQFLIHPYRPETQNKTYEYTGSHFFPVRKPASDQIIKVSDISYRPPYNSKFWLLLPPWNSRFLYNQLFFDPLLLFFPKKPFDQDKKSSGGSTRSQFITSMSIA